MSLFDVIKYPLSYPPTEEQLEALPCDLYTDWLAKSGFEASWPCDQMALWFSQHHADSTFYEFDKDRKDERADVVALRDFRRLQRIILEYEE